MTGDPDRDDDLALAAEYALGLLTPPEAQGFEARLAVDPTLRALYADWAEDFAAMADQVAPVTPPASVLAAINAQLFPEERQSWPKRIGLIPSLIGAFVAASLVLLFTWQGLLAPEPEPGPAYHADIAADDQSLVVAARFDPATGTLEIDRRAGAAAEGRSLELWLIAGENAPVSLGILPEAQTGSLVVDPALVAALAGGVLAISDEPSGGSPTGAPTGAVLAVGPVATL